MSQEEEDRAQNAYIRAKSTHAMWLNDVFRFRDSFFRIAGSGTRISALDIFWMIFILVLWLGIGFGIRSLIGDVWLFFDPLVLIFEALLLAWFVGRRVGHLSPLKRKTGEGTSVWIFQQIRQITNRVNSVTQGDIVYNVYPSFINGKWVNVECIEWIGTTKARRMPHFSSEKGNRTTDLYLVPRGVSNNWTRK